MPRTRLVGAMCNPHYANLVKSYGRKRYGKGILKVSVVGQ